MFINLVRIFPSASDQEAVRGFLTGLLEPTRVQRGCLSCTLAIESDPDAFLYMECWESKADLLRHLRSDEYAKILAMMELSTRKPDVSVYDVANEQGLELIEKVRMADPDSEQGSA
ncbi:MAG: Antibiotic biosynthesis monooxygenase [Bacteroidetes bacterium]|jgi:quinol monooxygenase YgiN|nr:Antibiotic biosynthesis monooxygenase [Bacteroidota bacterium]